MENPNKYLGNELKYVEKVLNSENWSSTGGSWNKHLEEKFCSVFQTEYAVSMNSGTSAIHATLEAMGIGPGDEVLSPALTVVMDATATLHANAVPIFVDVDPTTLTMDPQDLRRKITPRSKAVIIVSLYGLPAEMDQLMSIAIENDLKVIEDNCQCVLSTYKNRLMGQFGDAAIYSFENTKHMSCGEGGMVTTGDDVLAQNIRKIGGHGFKNLTAREGRIRLNQEIFQNPNYKRHDMLGWNYRLPEVNAAIALAQLERIDELIAQRVQSAEIFLEVMADNEILQPQDTPHDRTHSYYTLGATYNGEEMLGVTWEEFRKSYIDHGGDGIYGSWSVPYLEPIIKDRGFRPRYPEVYEFIDYELGNCPVAEAIQPKIMQFKTNYRDIELAKQKAFALSSTIDSLRT